MSETSNGRMPSSRWIQEFNREIMRRRHVLLYGNVNDNFLRGSGDHGSVNDILLDSLANFGFKIAVKYDRIDAFEFAQPGMVVDFQAVLRELSGAPDLGPPAKSGSPIATAGEMNNARPVQTSPPLPTDAKQAFTQIRTMLRQNKTSFAAIVDLTDMLTKESTTFDQTERDLVMLLKKCSLEAETIECEKGKFLNTLVLVGSDLKRIPDWLYRDNPYIGLVQIDRPDKEERKQFALRYTRPSASNEGLHGFDTLSDVRPEPSLASEGNNVSPLEIFADEFSDLTDGMQRMELEALKLTSHNVPEDLPAGNLQSLIDYFKFGNHEDPWGKLDVKKISDAKSKLEEWVIGQPKAVEAAVAMLTRARVGLSMSATRAGGKPKGIFFFVGPTGVGKTELAKAITHLVFSDEKAFARFDMSEYQQEHSAEKLCGAPPGFVGHEQGGQLTDRVRRHPHSILLFDEIDKAHPRVLDKFLQILEDGRLTDGKGDTAYFNQTAIIFTSNIGATSVSSIGQTEQRTLRGRLSRTSRQVHRASAQPIYSADGLPSPDQVEAHFKKKVKDFFTEIGRSELRSRLGDNIVVFDLLRPNHIKAICDKFLKRMKRVAMDKFELTLDIGSSIEELVLREMQDPEKMLLGGRQIGTTLETRVELELNRHIFLTYPSLSDLRGLTLRIEIINNVLAVSEVQRA